VVLSDCCMNVLLSPVIPNLATTSHLY